MMPRWVNGTQSLVQVVSRNAFVKSAGSGVMSSAVPRTPSAPRHSTVGRPFVSDGGS